MATRAVANFPSTPTVPGRRLPARHITIGSFKADGVTIPIVSSAVTLSALTSDVTLRLV